MSNIVQFKGGDYDVLHAAQKAEENGVAQGLIIGFDKDGKLYYSGFGNCSIERCIFMMEGVKVDTFTKPEK